MTKRTNALWFFVALLGGGAAIWLAKGASEDAWFAAMVAASVVLALMTYYLLNDEDAPEEEGDNVYYLGLLFTLISLMFTLVELFGADRAEVHDTKNIPVLLENFGIALTSTVVGIAGRVALQNWQRAASSESHEAALPPEANVQDLEEFNRHLLGTIARDLTQGANALARFHRIVRGYATDSEKYLNSHSEMLKRESAEFKDTLEQNADRFAMELKSQAESTLQAVGGSLSAVTKQAKALLEQLQFAHGEIQSVSNQNLNAIRQDFDAAAKQSLSLAENMSTVNEQVEKTFNNLASGLVLVSDASSTFSNSTKVTATAVQQIGETLLTISDESAAATKRAAGVAELLDSLTQSIQTTEGEIQRMAETFRTLASEAEERANNLHQRNGWGFKLWEFLNRGR